MKMNESHLWALRVDDPEWEKKDKQLTVSTHISQEPPPSPDHNNPLPSRFFCKKRENREKYFGYIHSSSTFFSPRGLNDGNSQTRSLAPLSRPRPMPSTTPVFLHTLSKTEITGSFCDKNQSYNLYVCGLFTRRQRKIKPKYSQPLHLLLQENSGVVASLHSSPNPWCSPPWLLFWRSGEENILLRTAGYPLI